MHFLDQRVYDIGQGYSGPKIRQSGPENQTLDPQKDCAAQAGIQTLDPQKRLCARPGVQTLDWPKRSFVQSCTQLLIWSHTLSKNFMCVQNICRYTNEFHTERVCWTTDDSQTEEKMDDRQTVLKMMNHSKWYVPCTTYLFWGTTSCSKLCTFLQAESACNKMWPKNVYHAHLHDKCMITVFCHQIIFVVT